MRHQQNCSQASHPTPGSRLFTRQQFLRWVGFSGVGFILSNCKVGGKTVTSQPAQLKTVTSEPAQLNYDAKNILPRRMVGFGGQLWLDDEKGLEMARDKSLGWSMVRLPIEDKIPYVEGKKSEDLKRPLGKSNNTPEEYDNYWKQFDTSKIKKYDDTLRKLGIISIYALLHPVDVWLKGENFNFKYIDQYAEYWAAHVAWMYKNGVKPKYIELHNEPDYKTSGIVTPDDYNKLVKKVRKKLDERRCSETLIIGPGVAHFDIITPDHEPNKYIDTLDEDGVKAIGAWSLHSYEWTKKQDDIENPQYVRNNWKDDKGFLKSIRSKDPHSSKDIFLTEHATKNTSYGGGLCKKDLCHSNDNEDGKTTETNAVSNTQPYGVRVFQNALAFINGGVNGIILFQARDQAWDGKHWGLDTINGHHRPVYHIMKTLSSAVPRGALVLKSPSQDESDIYAAAFMVKEQKQFIAAFANGTEKESAVTVNVKNANIKLLEAEAVENGKPSDGKNKVSQLSNNSFKVALKSESTLVVKFNIV